MGWAGLCVLLMLCMGSELFAAQDDVVVPTLIELPGLGVPEDAPAPATAPRGDTPTGSADSSPSSGKGDVKESQEIIPLSELTGGAGTRVKTTPRPQVSTGLSAEDELLLETPENPEHPLSVPPVVQPAVEEGNSEQSQKWAKDALSTTSPAAASQAPVPEALQRAGGAVAVLGDRKISFAEFYDELKKTHGSTVLSNLLNRLLLEEEFKRRGDAISTEDLSAAFERHMTQYRQKTSGAFEAAEFLRYHYGLTPAEYMRQAVWPEVAMRRLVRVKLNLTESDLFNYYYANRERYTRPAEVRVRHILIDPSRFRPGPASSVRAAGAREWDQAHAKALELVNRLRGGADFTQLARTESDDKTTAARGGDLGFFPRGAMVKPFEDAAFSLKKGAISELVKTVHGYHILRMEERTEERLMRFSEIKAMVREDYERYMVRSSAQKILTQLRMEALKDGRLRIFDPDLMPRDLKRGE